MACFLVSAAEAVVVTTVEKITAKKSSTAASPYQAAQRISFSQKLKWLSNMLWGGSVLLAFEHLWHGEVVPWFPFLTAMNDPADTAAMLGEMRTIGVLMAAIITAAWACMVLVTNTMERKVLSAGPAAVQ